MKNLSTRDITTIGLLIALNIVVSRYLSVPIGQIAKISFTFIVLAITGSIYGGIMGGIIAAVADVLGVLIWTPPGGAFIGFTLSAFVAGAIYGFALYQKPNSPVRIFIAVLLHTIIVSLLMNTYWLTIILGNDFVHLLTPRLIKNAIVAPIEFALLLVVMKSYEKYFASVISGLNRKKANI